MSVKICPQCGESNPEQAGICGVCGASLEQVKTVRALKSTQYPEPETDKDGISGGRPESTRSGGAFSALSGSAGIMAMLLIATIIYPFVGMIAGGAAALLGDRDKQETGAFLLLISLIIWALRLIIMPLFSD